MIKILKTVHEVKLFRTELGMKTVGFVPTMGALHQGHLELIKQSKKNNDVTVVSIFVNPAQFNNRNDFETYPDYVDSDIEKLKSLNVEALFLPNESEIYPNGYNYKLTENIDSLDLCGSARPGHFDGVLTVLIKLFNLVKPSHVYMGLKDYQQYKLVKNMTQDLFLDLEIHGVETVRESSGLALSSRNLNLTPEQKKTAELYASIFAQDLDLETIRLELETLDLKIDYLVEKWGRKFIAVFIGDVRLIDNRTLVLKEEKKNSSQDFTNNTDLINQPLEIKSSLVSENSIMKTKDVNPIKILFKMSGSIACYKGCDVISKLVQLGHEVKVVVTPDVFQFVGKATLEGLTGSSVYSDIYKDGEMMSHIHLNDWCDLVVLCPATANTLSKISLGLSDNLVTALALSSDTIKPYLIFPAMNSRMLSALPIQEALQKVKLSGKLVIEGEVGHLACGHTGSGRLAEVDVILNEILNYKNSAKLIKNNHQQNSEVELGLEKTASLNRKKILVTAGGTSEPIDPVRSITNTSTGATGLKIGEYLLNNYDVYLLGSDAMKEKASKILGLKHFETFKSFSDLELKLKRLLSEIEFEAIVHLAAVSDYSPIVIHFNDKSVELPTTEKLASSEDFIIEFKRNKKLITEIKSVSKNKNLKIIGFKLLRTDDQIKIQSEIDKILKDSDCVVVNSLENINDKKHAYEIYNLSGLMFHGNTKMDMAQDISKILEGEL
jgi:phosphopantothenoylcysteine decarboxylase / phosphopantothenate---cysteine ligase